MCGGVLFFILGLLPLAFIIAFCGLEFAISFIQAQVFVVLTSSYIKDALELHGDDSSKKVGGANLYRANLSSNKRSRRVSSLSFNSKGRYYSTISPVPQRSSTELNPWFLTGFADGEGCFYLSIQEAFDCKTG